MSRFTTCFKYSAILLLPFLMELDQVCAQKSLTARQLFSAQRVDLLAAKRAVFVFFKPSCAACRRQSKEMNCLGDPVYFIGLGGREKALKREVMRMQREGITYLLSDRDIEKHFQIVSQETPQIYAMKGNTMKKVLGFRTCSQVATMFK